MADRADDHRADRRRRGDAAGAARAACATPWSARRCGPPRWRASRSHSPMPHRPPRAGSTSPSTRSRGARNQGLGRAAAMGLIVDRMLRGLRPVWSAVKSNEASHGLARRLGFEPVDLLWVLTRNGMIKVELHAHTSDDPGDRIPHDTHALLDHAARFGYGALAVTLHNRWFDPAPFDEYAAARGIVLLSGIEKTIDGKHVLLINVPREAGDLRSFDDVRALKAADASGARCGAAPVLSDPQRAGCSPGRARRRGRRSRSQRDVHERAGLQPPGPRLGRPHARRWSATPTCTGWIRSARPGARWTRRQTPTPSARPSAPGASSCGRVRSAGRARCGRWRGWNSAGSDGLVTIEPVST